MAELNKLLDPKDVVFNEAIRNAGSVSMQITRPLPNTMMRSAGGGLGWSGGFALGAKLAAPDRMMVQVVGDGSFYFGNPSSVFSAAAQYKLPILIIVTDNTGWGAVKASTLRVFPRRGGRRRRFPVEAAARRGFQQDCRGVRRLWRKNRRPRRSTGRARALRQGSARRTHRHPACAGDEAVTVAGNRRVV